MNKASKKWVKEGVTIQDTSLLLLTSVRVSDSGIYWCIGEKFRDFSEVKVAGMFIQFISKFFNSNNK